ncbi:MAG: hypothetical protein ABI689_13115 [Thermoanaerobaculia bacterium]
MTNENRGISITGYFFAAAIAFCALAMFRLFSDWSDWNSTPLVGDGLVFRTPLLAVPVRWWVYASSVLALAFHILGMKRISGRNRSLTGGKVSAALHVSITLSALIVWSWSLFMLATLPGAIADLLRRAAT